jgi:hypothetical protein
MRKIIIGISAAIALSFIGTLDADAAKISGNFCCGAGAHQVCCNRRVPLRGAHASAML